MEYRKLGKTQIDVSLICLGTMNWGDQNDQQEAFAQMDYSLEKGINFFDTAELYPVPPKSETYTRTETIIGNWFAERGGRDKIILATKIAGRSKELDWIREGKNKFDRTNLTLALEGSLKRLKTDYVDLYQLHWPNRKTNFFGKLGFDPAHDPEEILIEESLTVIKEFLEQGKIRHYGLSNETPWGVMNCIKKAKELSMPAPVSIQNPYNLLNRTFEIGNSEVSFREKVGLLAYSPLAFGVLSGKYLKGQKPKGSRLDRFSGHFNRYNSDISTSATNQYVKVAQKFGLSPSQMALSYINAQPFVTSNIIGASNMGQLKEDIESIHISLSPEVLEEINKIHKEKPNPAP